MPVIQGRTREQLRQDIGYALGSLSVSAATESGSTTTLKDNSIVLGGADSQIGKWIRFTSGSNDTLTRRVTDSSISSNVTTLTFMPAVGTSTASESYELWDTAYNPDVIDNFMNQSITSVTGSAYDPIENISLHGDKKQTRFDIPSGISMISKIEYRKKITSLRIHECNTTFDEATDSDLIQSLDTQDRKQGNQSLKISVGPSAGGGEFIADSISSTDLSKYDTIEMWIKSTVATSSGNLKLHLDSETVVTDTSDKENLDIPALTADTWTFVRLSLDNPEIDTAIVSVGLEYDSDPVGVPYVWIDDIMAVANDTAEWETLPRHLWKIDKEARSLILVRDGQDAVGYSLMKITGGDKPALLSSDSSSTEIDDNFLVANTVNLALISSSGGPATDPDAKRQLSSYWAATAERARKSIPMLVNVRHVD